MTIIVKTILYVVFGHLLVDNFFVGVSAVNKYTKEKVSDVIITADGKTGEVGKILDRREEDLSQSLAENIGAGAAESVRGIIYNILTILPVFECPRVFWM